jgi:hypothetical protein
MRNPIQEKLGTKRVDCNWGATWNKTVSIAIRFSSIWNVKTHGFEGYWISDGVWKHCNLEATWNKTGLIAIRFSSIVCVKLHSFDRYWISNNLAWMQSRSNSEQNRSDCNQILMYWVREITRYQASDALRGNIAIQEQLRKQNRESLHNWTLEYWVCEICSQTLQRRDSFAVS